MLFRGVRGLTNPKDPKLLIFAADLIFSGASVKYRLAGHVKCRLCSLPLERVLGVNLCQGLEPSINPTTF